MKTVIIAIGIFLTQISQAEVIEVNSYADILKHLASPEETLVVTDLDNTVLQPKQMIGSDQWGEYMNHKLQNRGFTKEESTQMAVAMFASVQMATPLNLFETVEKETSNILKLLKRKKYTVIGLTARPQYLATQTVEVLNFLKINFDDNKTSRLNHVNWAGIRYQDGVFFVGAFNNKGQILKQILDQLSTTAKLKYKRVLFIDDKSHHVKSVDQFISSQDVKVYSLRYGAADNRVKNFNEKIADYQWTILMSSGQIVSDESAHRQIIAAETSMNIAYKILTVSEYDSYLKGKDFMGSATDLKDGFIHLSTELQLERTLNKYFSGQPMVYILKINLDLVNNQIKWEKASNGDIYPHLYQQAIYPEIVISVEQRKISI